MLRLDIRGMDKTVRVMDGIIKRMKTEPTKMTSKMALSFKKKVHKHLERGGKGQGAGHNTPTSLRRRLKRRAFTGGHKVFFDRREEEFLPTMVEYGTPPHPQFDNPIIYHPGSEPKHFWRDARREFKRTTQKRLVKETGRRIVWGRK